jgi:hypothetical protein
MKKEKKREIMGYIKFKDKKATIKPLEDKKGPKTVWEISDSHNSKEFFRYKGVRYQLVSTIEPK